MERCIEFLAVGHVTRDVFPQGDQPGGSVCYAGLAAAALGRRTAIWTSHGPDFPFVDVLDGVACHLRPAAETTTFETRYQAGQRFQWVRGVASRLEPSALPDALRRAPVVYLCPVLDEVELALASCFPGALVGIGVQGWVRQLGPDAAIVPRRWTELEPWIRSVRVAVLSEVEAEAQPGLVEQLRDAVPLVAVTHGARGSTLYRADRSDEIPAVAATEVDPTGAGDVYGAALLIRLGAGDDPVQAARFASAAAARVVEGQGITNLGALAGLSPRGLPEDRA